MPASDKNFPGRPLNRSARVWNKIIDHVDAADRLPVQPFASDNGVDVQIRNDTGADQPLGSAVAINADAYILTWAEANYYSFWFAGSLPASDSNTFAILLAAIKSGEIGPARVSGRAMVRLRLTDVGHRQAKLTAGQTYLTSAGSVSGQGVKIIALQPTLSLPDQVVPAILLPSRPCLPPYLIRDVRIADSQLIKDVWYTDQDCDQYTPYVIADFTDCYVPDSPYAPAGTLQYFGDDFVLADHPEWTAPDPWQFGPPGVDDNMALYFPGGSPPSPAELTVTIGSSGGFVQFSFTTNGSVGANVFIDGYEILPSQSTGPGEWVTAGPYSLDPGSHTISFHTTGSSGDCTYDDITVWGV
jgi:hypothetical protein